MVRRTMIKKKLKKVRIKMDSFAAKILSRAMVLIYHRVANVGSDPQRLSVTPENFEKHMQYVAREFQPISLLGMVDGLKRGVIHDRAIVVTFDDGYEDNYINARPILEKLNVPATIFVSSGYSSAKREFWLDELERLIVVKDSLPDEISIELGGEKHNWKVLTSGGSANIDDKLWSPHDIYTDLCARFQSLSAEEIDEGIAQLRELTNDNGEARPENIPMSKEQLRSLSRGGLIEIGAHTRSHINLAAQTANRQWDEIEGSKKDLEKILGKNIESFSYPFGTLDHYTDMSVKCVKEVGFKNAVSNYTGNVTRLTSLYEIPRRMVRDWDDMIFKEMLGEYYEGRLKATANSV